MCVGAATHGEGRGGGGRSSISGAGGVGGCDCVSVCAREESEW